MTACQRLIRTFKNLQPVHCLLLCTFIGILMTLASCFLAGSNLLPGSYGQIAMNMSIALFGTSGVVLLAMFMCSLENKPWTYFFHSCDKKIRYRDRMTPEIELETVAAPSSTAYDLNDKSSTVVSITSLVIPETTHLITSINDSPTTHRI